MKAAHTLIAWNPNGDDPPFRGAAPAGSIGIGPLYFEHDGNGDWSRPYRCSGGAAYTERRKLSGIVQQHQVMLDWYQLVYSYGIEPYLAHLAFLEIDEYQDVIKDMGCGPAKGERGHDPNIPYGRSVTTELPRVRILRRGDVTHFWPEYIKELAA